MMLICAFVAACADRPKPSPDPSVQIPRDCEQLAQQVPEPSWSKGANPKALLADTTIALVEANGHLDATRTCQERQRESFALPSRVTE